MNKKQSQPLADRVRPEKLKDFFGQEELVGEKSFLHEAIELDTVPSMILWGPPGCGKTTLAHVIAKQTESDFIQISAVTSGKKDLMRVVEEAEKMQRVGRRTILFIDEIHRWNKAQQDALLPHVEKGIVTLIGATTENPSFEVIGALVSRSRVFVLKKLSSGDIEKILKRAIKILPLERGGEGGVDTSNKKSTTPDPSFPMRGKGKIDKKVINLIANLSNGDARMALNTLEACQDAVGEKARKKISEKLVREVLQKQHLLYDKSGEEHYNIISALHKSMRGGNANAAVYWLARMLEGGEDPVYIARRLVRFAAEDVGLADNHALILANAVFDACRKLGMPECNVHLAQCVIYLSKTKKNIMAYEAYNRAKKDVEKFGNLDVPLHLRNAPTKLMKELDYGKDYKYSPKEDSSEQTYLPKKLGNKKYL